MDLTDAIRIIDSGNPFDCEFVSYDRHRKTGGEIKRKHLKKISSSEYKESRHYSASSEKNKSNSDDLTRNFIEMAGDIETSAICKVHLILILSVNGQNLRL